MEVSQAERLKDLEKENARLKKIVADQVLGLEIQQEALEIAVKSKSPVSASVSVQKWHSWQ